MEPDTGGCKRLRPQPSISSELGVGSDLSSSGDVGIIVQKIKTRQRRQHELMYDMRRELESSSDLDGPNSMFLATDAVSWLVTSQNASNAGEAVAMGKQLFQDRLILPVQSEINFQNIKRWWRFSVDCVELTSHHLFPTLDLNSLVLLLSQNVVIKDRKYRLHTHRRCFVGSEAVSWMICQNYAFCEEEGVLICKTMESMGLIESATPGRPFECTESCFFRISDRESKTAARKRTLFDLLRAPIMASTHMLLASKHELQDESILDTAVSMQQHIRIRTRRRGFKSYHECFDASDAIQWLIQSGRVDSRSHGRNRLQSMIDSQLIRVAKATFLSKESDDPLDEFYTFNKEALRLGVIRGHRIHEYGKLDMVETSRRELIDRENEKIRHRRLVEDLHESLADVPGLLDKAVECNMRIDRVSLIRYLRSVEFQRNGVRKPAKHKIIATVTWLKKCDAGTLTSEAIASEFDEHLPFYIRGRDRDGRPVVYFRPGEVDISTARFHRLALFTLLACTNIAGDEGICVIVDCLHLTRNLLPSSSAILAYASALFSHFPELLGKMFVLHANRSIYTIWQLVSHHLSRRTLSKIVFLSNRGNGIRYALATAIDTDVLESQYHSGQFDRNTFCLSEYLTQIQDLLHARKRAHRIESKSRMERIKQRRQRNPIVVATTLRQTKSMCLKNIDSVEPISKKIQRHQSFRSARNTNHDEIVRTENDKQQSSSRRISSFSTMPNVCA